MSVDPQFGLDSYNRAKVLTESQTVAYNILTILFARPGMFPSMPQIGMNIQQYLYSFKDDLNTESIKAKLSSQCSDFVNCVQDGTFDIIKTDYNGDPMLVFVIPTVFTNTETNLILGVTVSSNGEYKFNFTYDKTQFI